MRYEPHSAAGKIVGGFIVAQDPEDPLNDLIKGSDCNAGYKRQVKKYGGQEFASPLADLWVRPFVAPTYSGKSDDHECLKLAKKKCSAIEEALTDELTALTFEPEQLDSPAVGRHLLVEKLNHPSQLPRNRVGREGHLNQSGRIFRNKPKLKIKFRNKRFFY